MDEQPPTGLPTQTTEVTPAPMAPAPKKVNWLMVVAGLVVIAGAALGAGYAWSKHSTKKTVANRVVKIGLIAPLTGDLANYGQVFQHGVELAQRDFNQEGLSFQVYVRDTVCDPAKAASATTELANLGVSAIIGDTCSGSTLAALPIANQKKVLLISPSASSTALTTANDFFFRTYPTDSHQGVFVTQRMQAKGVKKLAIMYGDEAYGTGLDTVAQDNFKKLGGTVVANTVFKSTDTDFKARLQAIQAAKPDALYIVSEDETASAAIMVEAKQIGLTVPVYGSDALKDVNFITDVGAAGEGMTVVAVTPGDQAFLDKYKAAYGSEPANATGAQAYDAFMALARVIKNGATTGDQIRQALPKVDFQGVSGEIKFDNYGDLAGGSYNVYTIQNGKFVLTN